MNEAIAMTLLFKKCFRLSFEQNKQSGHDDQNQAKKEFPKS